MNIYCSVIGRRWDLSTPHITQALLWGFAKGLEDQGHKIIPWHWDSPFPIEPGAFLVQPGFNLPGGKYVIATKRLMQMCKFDKRHLILFTGDVENLHTWWPYVHREQIWHGLVTSFKTPWKAWKAQWYFHERSAYYPLDLLLKDVGSDEIKFSLGYVGWPKPARFTVIKRIGYLPLTMLGYGANKQDMFDSAFCDKNTPYPFLGELFKACAWQLCVSDPIINEVMPCVCRQFEAWRFNRPCAFHVSFVNGMKYVDFSKVSDWIFTSDFQLHKICKQGMRADGSYDAVELARIAKVQQDALQGQMLDPHPVVARTLAYLKAEYGTIPYDGPRSEPDPYAKIADL